LADGSWSALLARLALALEPAIPAPGASAIPAAFTPSVARTARRDAAALTQSHPCTADEFSRYISVIHSRVSKGRFINAGFINNGFFNQGFINP
jgi:hypothetical protein